MNSERDAGLEMPSEPAGFTEVQINAILEGLTDAAIVVGPDLSILAVNQAYLQCCSHGVSVRGRRCYEVSHHYKRPCNEMGEHCPIADCRETGQPCRAVHVHYNYDGAEHDEITAYPVTDEDGQTRAFLEVTRPIKVATPHARAHCMVGRSPAFNCMLKFAQQAAPRDTPVLLLGETGTGKELLARAIHEMSQRRDRPFVAVDCSGISESLFESELFGHERGAFTGAVTRKIGLVESVAGGTLFLDEVGDIPLPQQVKLLRLLETRTFRRVGSVEMLRADFRIVCATHRDLKDMVAEGSFRADLYHRINVFPIEVPPLRARRADLSLLAESMLKQAGCATEKKIHPETVKLLKEYDFRGNIRELRNVMERACLLTVGNVILPEHLPDELRVTGNSPAPPPVQQEDILPLSEVERRYLAWAVESFSGDKRELASRLGLSERTFYRKIKELHSNGGGPSDALAKTTPQPGYCSRD